MKKISDLLKNISPYYFEFMIVHLDSKSHKESLTEVYFMELKDNNQFEDLIAQLKTSNSWNYIYINNIEYVSITIGKGDIEVAKILLNDLKDEIDFIVDFSEGLNIRILRESFDELFNKKVLLFLKIKIIIGRN